MLSSLWGPLVTSLNFSVIARHSVPMISDLLHELWFFANFLIINISVDLHHFPTGKTA